MKSTGRLVRSKYRLVVGLTLLCVLVPVLTLWATLPSLPSFDQVRKRTRPSDLVLLDRDGQVLHELRVNDRIRRLPWVALEKMSPALPRAVVEAEDHRFYSHSGVDWRSVLGSLWDWSQGGELRGASTISMQLCGYLQEELERRGSRRTWLQKVRQAASAWRLELEWSKEEILEAYLNLVTFRGELQGIGAAARGLFDKDPHGLTAAESDILACLIRSPNASHDDVRGRALFLARDSGGGVSEAALSEAAAALDKGYRITRRAHWAPHVARALLEPGAGARAVRSTLRGDLQIFAAQTLADHLARLTDQNVRDGAVLVVDNATGDVLAYVGNGGKWSSARQVDGIRAFRQAGSSLKPLLYARAFERRLITPISLLNDSPVEIPVVGGVYRPSNYDDRFRGPVTARVALASSLNVPAVRLLLLVGVDDFVQLLDRLHFSGLRGADYYGPSLALGSADVRLWDLVAAYTALARGGEWIEPGFEPVPVRRAERVLSPQACFLVDHILSDRENRSETFGLESPLATRYWSAVKTGTSKDMRDNWCVGFNDRYTVGVWVGNFSGEPMWDVSGISGAAPVWLEVMDWLNRDLPSHAPDPPAGVERRTVSVATGGDPVSEWFIRGTVPVKVQVVTQEQPVRISYPADGSIFAADPDIPASLQKIFFEAEPPNAGLIWRLNGRCIGGADRLVRWRPREGRYELALCDDRGKVYDQVTFFVRGSVGSR